MIIAIDGSRAFLKQRTGIEEYSYQVIKHLRDKLDGHQVVLYVRKNQKVDFEMPGNWKIKTIRWPRFWTQLGLSLEMLLRPADVLFVPAHTVPWIHPKKTVVVVHGLEYEIMPQAYSKWGRLYMRCSIRNSCRWAEKVVSVSRNTKQDLVRLYGIPEDKIQVVYEGYDLENSKSVPDGGNSDFQKYKPFLLFVGRLEERKNIVGIIKAFEILKEKHGVPHKLLLAGGNGYGFPAIGYLIENSKYKDDIIRLGFVPDEKKFELISQADIFMFPTFYEGFGIPVLEAQSVGVPVIASNTSSIPEVAGDSAVLVDPDEAWYIAERTYELISDREYRGDMVKRGYENVKRFGWDGCAEKISDILKEK
ncbi:MAG: glycosyltransferase family 1 protein [Parcubacteria group bacterium]